MESKQKEKKEQIKESTTLSSSHLRKRGRDLEPQPSTDWIKKVSLSPSLYDFRLSK